MLIIDWEAALRYVCLPRFMFLLLSPSMYRGQKTNSGKFQRLYFSIRLFIFHNRDTKSDIFKATELREKSQWIHESQLLGLALLFLIEHVAFSTISSAPLGWSCFPACCFFSLLSKKELPVELISIQWVIPSF